MPSKSSKKKKAERKRQAREESNAANKRSRLEAENAAAAAAESESEEGDDDEMVDGAVAGAGLRQVDLDPVIAGFDDEDENEEEEDEEEEGEGEEEAEEEEGEEDEDGESGSGSGSEEEEEEESESEAEPAVVQRPAAHENPDLDATSRTLALAFKDIDGYEVARAARAKLRQTKGPEGTEHLQYGEVDFLGFKEVVAEALRHLQLPLAEARFVDIGSGTGKAVFIAAAHAKFARATGIEIVPELHAEATKAQKILDKGGAKKEKGGIFGATKVELVLGDAFKQDWADAAVVYAPCTCFTDDMMAELLPRLEQLREGAVIITTSRPLDSRRLRRVHSGRYKYARGRLLFNIYLRAKRGRLD